eukprot:6191786-Pleurochrysis_carterae.AAC.2
MEYPSHFLGFQRRHLGHPLPVAIQPKTAEAAEEHGSRAAARRASWRVLVWRCRSRRPRRHRAPAPRSRRSGVACTLGTSKYRCRDYRCPTYDFSCCSLPYHLRNYKYLQF